MNFCIFVLIKTLRNILPKLKPFAKWFFIVNGIFFVIIMILSFTTLPFWMYYDLSVSEHKLTTPPEYIVVMSGGGIPSESGLMRTYKTAEMAKIFTDAKIIVTMPGDTADTSSSCSLMKKEIVLRGVNPNRIIFENVGTNTRSQAQETQKIIKTDAPTLIITSPEHIYRSVKCFNKLGMTNVTGEPAFAQEMEADFSFDDNKLGGNTTIPDIGNNIQVRYQFWNHLRFQILVYREYVAIAFYKIKGWI
ncbi:MAG: YdcF family protein [Flavobacteriales bacterium]